MSPVAVAAWVAFQDELAGRERADGKVLVAPVRPAALALSCLTPDLSMRRVKMAVPSPASVPISALAVPCSGPVPLVSATFHQHASAEINRRRVAVRVLGGDGDGEVRSSRRAYRGADAQLGNRFDLVLISADVDEAAVAGKVALVERRVTTKRRNGVDGRAARQDGHRKVGPPLSCRGPSMALIGVPLVPTLSVPQSRWRRCRRR